MTDFTTFDVLDGDYSKADEHCGRVVLDDRGYIEPHIDETDSWIALPVRLIHSQAGGFGIEIGPYTLDTADIRRMRAAITTYDAVTKQAPAERNRSD